MGREREGEETRDKTDKFIQHTRADFLHSTANKDKAYGKFPEIKISFIFLVFSRAASHTTWRFPGWGQIGAVAAGLHQSHSNAGSKPHLQPTPQLTARAGTEPATSWFLVGFVNHCATTGIPRVFF